MESETGRSVAYLPPFVRGGDRYQLFRGQSREPRSSEPGSSDQLQHQNESGGRAFGVSAENGKTDQGELFLRK